MNCDNDDSIEDFRAKRIAARLETLKKATLAAAAKRERLPQPLFWSLFHSQIKEIRASKERLREASELLSGGEENS